MIRNLLLGLLLLTFSSYANAATTVVQVAVDSAAGSADVVIDGAGGAADTWAGPIPAGDILVACLSARPNGSTASATLPAGWSTDALVTSFPNGFSASGQIMWKVSDPSDTSISFPVGNSFGSSVAIMQISGSDNTPVAFIQDITEDGNPSSQSISTTITSTAANEFAVACGFTFVANRWESPAITQAGWTIQGNEESTGQGGVIAATRQLTTAAGYPIEMTTADTGHRSMIMGFTLGEGTPSLTFTNNNPALGESITANLSAALDGGNPTSLVLPNGNTVACSFSTPTSCDFTVPAHSELNPAGAFSTTGLDIAHAAVLTDGVNNSLAADITFTIAAGTHIATLTCDKDTPADCDDDTLAISPQTNGDQCIYQETTTTLQLLTTHCSLIFPPGTASATGKIAHWDDSAGTYLMQTDYILANTAPTISAIANVSIVQDTATSAIAFTVADLEIDDALITVSAASDNQTIIPDGNIALTDGGAGSWSVIVTPAAGQVGGPVTITLTVGDLITTTLGTFTVTVTPDVTAPILSGLAISDIQPGGTYDVQVSTDEAGGNMFTFLANDPVVTCLDVTTFGTSFVPTLGVNNLDNVAAIPGNYYLHTCQVDTAGNVSAIQTSTTFSVLFNGATEATKDVNVAPYVCGPLPDLYLVNSSSRNIEIGASLCGCQADPANTPLYGASGSVGFAGISTINTTTGVITVPNWGTDTLYRVSVTCDNSLGPQAQGSFNVIVGSP